MHLAPAQGHLSGINNDCYLKATKEDVIRITGVQGAHEFIVYVMQLLVHSMQSCSKRLENSDLNTASDSCFSYTTKKRKTDAPNDPKHRNILQETN